MRQLEHRLLLSTDFLEKFPPCCQIARYKGGFLKPHPKHLIFGLWRSSAAQSAPYKGGGGFLKENS